MDLISLLASFLASVITIQRGLDLCTCLAAQKFLRDFSAQRRVPPLLAVRGDGTHRADKNSLKPYLSLLGLRILHQVRLPMVLLHVNGIRQQSADDSTIFNK